MSLKQRAARARRLRLKQAKMSMLEFKARAAAITGSSNLQQSAESQVSRATTCKSLTSGSYKDAEQQQDHDSLNESMETVKDRNTKPSKTGQTIELGVPKLEAEPETTWRSARARRLVIGMTRTRPCLGRVTCPLYSDFSTVIRPRLKSSVTVLSRQG